MDGREREGPKLLLNQGPSEPYYATVAMHIVNTVSDLNITLVMTFVVSDDDLNSCT